MSPKLLKNRVGIQIVTKIGMARKSFKNLLLILGILVAFIVIILFNAEIVTSQSATMDPPSNGLNELSYYSIPNLIFYLF